jgi:tetratricopeptide (TPR) repeat protein
MRSPGLVASLAAAAAVLGTLTPAQDWRGMGRVEGRVLDEAGAPVAGAEITLTHTALKGGPTVTADEDGKWAVGGIDNGAWLVRIQAEGFNPAETTIGIPRAIPVEVHLKRAKPLGPPPELLAHIDDGNALYEAEKYAEARVAFEKALALWDGLEPAARDGKAKVAIELHSLIARCYNQEDDVEKELEHLQHVLDADPANSNVRLLMAQEALRAGMTERGHALLADVDESAVTDPDVFYNVAVLYLNQSNSEEALPYLTKAIGVDPTYVDGYFQRALAYFNLERYAEAKADCDKVIELAPDGEQAQTATALMEAISSTAGADQ